MSLSCKLASEYYLLSKVALLFINLNIEMNMKKFNIYKRDKKKYSRNYNINILVKLKYLI